MTVVAVLLAGAAGAVLRYLASLVLAGRRFPWAVLVVNVAGSLLAGAAAAALEGDARLILLTGFCGGLTTFSALSVETVQLVLDGRTRVAALSVAANLVAGIAAAALGYLLFA